jgi:hypothetical protein
MRSNWDWKTHRRCGGQSSHSPKHDELWKGKVGIEEIEDGSGSGETLETKRIEGIGGIEWDRIGNDESQGDPIEREEEKLQSGERKRLLTSVQELYNHDYIIIY